jgi:hypothetical protein
MIGMNASRRRFPSIPFEIFRTSIGVSPVRDVACGNGGTLFYAAHAIMHDPHPVHRSRLITMP